MPVLVILRAGDGSGHVMRLICEDEGRLFVTCPARDLGGRAVGAFCPELLAMTYRFQAVPSDHHRTDTTTIKVPVVFVS